jgi:modification methylase
MERVIGIASNPGEVVLDGFMGTGTTAVVAKRMGRKFIGIEKDDFYIDIARKRLDSPVKALGVGKPTPAQNGQYP